MCGAAIYLAVIKSETPNIFAAIVTAYMVVTARLAASRRTGKRGAAQIGTCLVAVAGGISAFRDRLESCRRLRHDDSACSGCFLVLWPDGDRCSW